MGSGIRASLVLVGGLLFTAAIVIATQYNLLVIALGAFGSILFALREGFTGSSQGLESEKPPTKLVWFVLGVALVLITLAPVFGAFSPAAVVASGGSGGASSGGGGGGSSLTPTCGNPCVINIQNSQFGAGSQLQSGNGYVVVKAGTIITWVNKDVTQHTTTSNTAGLWDSGILNSGKSFSHTFSTPGTFTYFCNVHPMSGTVVVVS